MKTRRFAALFLFMCVLLCACEKYNEESINKNGDFEISDEIIEDKTEESYVLNNNSKKFHYPSCHSAKQIKVSNREDYTGTREEIIKKGYSPCGNCKP